MTDQSQRVRRRWLYIPFIIAGVILLAYYLLWRAGAAEMKKGVEAWIADQQSAGMAVTHGPIKSEGFPFFLRVHIEEPDISQPDVWRWRAERLTLDALPYDLDKLIFSTRGEQSVWLDGYGEWRVTADDFRTSIANDETRDWVFAATIGELQAVRQEDGEAISLESLVLDLAPDAADKYALDANLAASRAIIGSDEDQTTFDSIQTRLTLTETYALSAENPASAWRSVGGALQIKRLIAEMEDARLSVSGAVRLDSDHYPAGTLHAEATAPAAFAAALGRAGVMTSQEAESAAAALTLAAIAGGGKIIAPIELKHGNAHIAGVTLAQLPRVE